MAAAVPVCSTVTAADADGQDHVDIAAKPGVGPA